MASKKAPAATDVHVGTRIRMRRMLLGMSQEKLGDALGITFQQVQKYEKGTNRVGASRLQDIATALKTQPSYFFEDAPGVDGEARAGFGESSHTYVMDFLTTSEGVALTSAFTRIRDPKVRRRIVDLVQSLAEDEDA